MLIGFSILLAIFFLAAFIWSMKSGQYDDTYSPSVRILFDQKISHKTKSSDNERKD